MAGYLEESEDSNAAIDIRELVYVKTDEGYYRGWKTELLVEKITLNLEGFLICKLCSGLLRDACLFENEGNQEFRCSECTTGNSKRLIAQHNRKEINKIQVECPFKLKGCEWTDIIDQIHYHLTECDFFPVLCPLKCIKEEDKDNGTIYRMDRKLLEEHQNSLCPMRQVTCDFCTEGVKACEMDNHLEECEEFVIPCPNQCDEGEGANRYKRKSLPSHLGEDCPLEEVDCPYANYGCIVRKKRKLMDEHESENVNRHFKLAITGMEKNQTGLVTRIDKLENDILEKDKHIQDLEKSLYTSESKATLEWKINDVKKKIDNKEITLSEPLHMGFYKLRCRIQWDFGSKANVACFLCIVKGEEDDKLAWPVRYKYRIVLVNRLNITKSHEKSHTVNKNDLGKFPKCFSKPKDAEENEAFGWSDFIPQVEILTSKYAKDDSIIIHIHLKQLPW